MKKIIHLVLCYLCCSLVSAQDRVYLESAQIDQIYHSKKHIPQVSGKLLNYDVALHKDLQLRLSSTTIEDFRGRPTLVPIQSDGSFKLAIDNALPYQHLFLRIGNYYTGSIIAHDGLKITADLDEIQGNRVMSFGTGIDFEGPDVAINEYFYAYRRFRRFDRRRLSRKRSKIVRKQDRLGQARRIALFKQINRKQERIERAFVKRNPSPYAWLLSNDRMSTFYNEMMLAYRGNAVPEEILEEMLKHKPAMLSHAGVYYYYALNGILHFLPDPLKKYSSDAKCLQSLTLDPSQQEQLNTFLAAYENKSKHLAYDVKAFEAGENTFLKPFAKELKAAWLDHYIEKLTALSPSKADLILLCGQPENLFEREAYQDKVLPSIHSLWVKELMEKSYREDKAEVERIEKALKAARKIRPMYPWG